MSDIDLQLFATNHDSNILQRLHYNIAILKIPSNILYITCISRQIPNLKLGTTSNNVYLNNCEHIAADA